MDLFRSEDFKARIQRFQEKHHVPGVAIALVHNDEVQSTGFGMASLDPPKPCLPDTLFDIASCSKSFTAASIELLVQDDDKFPEVKYDALMSELLGDDFVMPESSYTNQVTLDDIVSHRSGMGRHDLSYLGPRAKHPDTPQSVVRNLRNLTVDAPIRTKEIYNNMMYTAMAYLVEVKTGKPFSKYLEEAIFRPLGMDSTYLHASNTRKAGLEDRIATGYAWPEDEQKYRIVTAMDQPEAIGAGNILTSANEGIKWIQAMMNHDGPVITKDVYKGIVRPRIIEEEVSKFPFTSQSMYCSGWYTSYYRGYRIIEHDGGDFGFGSTHFFLPDLKFGGVMYGNSGAIGNFKSILRNELVDEVLQVPKEERPDWASYESDDDSDKEDDDQDETENKALHELYPDIKEPCSQERPLGLYTGIYQNVGYHDMVVEIKDNKLYIDASDRSMGFYVTFEHVADQTKYIAWQSDYWEGGQEPSRAEFDFGTDRRDTDKACRVGISLDTEELVWFDRVEAFALR